MNLSEVQRLKDGDLVEFKMPFPLFEVGKRYRVRKTSIGCYVDDERGRGYPLAFCINLENWFEKPSPL